MPNQDENQPVNRLIHINLLRACAECAANGDVRRYLEGVRVEKRGDRTVYQATDGHVLFAAVDETDPQDPDFSLTIPVDVAKAVRPETKGIVHQQLIKLDVKNTRHEWILCGRAFRSIAGSREFPDASTTWPKKLTHAWASVNIALLNQIQRAMNIACGRAPTHKSGGRSMGLALFNGRDGEQKTDQVMIVVPAGGPITMAGLVMPYKAEKSCREYEADYLTALPTITMPREKTDAKDKS